MKSPIFAQEGLRHADEWCPLILLKGDPSHESVGSEIVHKRQNCLATCYYSTSVSRGRPNCLQMSCQETQADLQIISNNIENARLHHYNVCLL